MSDTTEASTGTEAIEAAAAAITGGAATEDHNESNQSEADTESIRDDTEGDLGDAGKRALRAERDARLAAERALKAARDEVPQLVADQLRDHLTDMHGFTDDEVSLYLNAKDAQTLLRQASGLVQMRRKAEETAESKTATPKPDLTQGAQHAAALNGDGLTDALARAVGAR